MQKEGFFLSTRQLKGIDIARIYTELQALEKQVVVKFMMEEVELV
jgi:hypothetical protein